MPAAPLLCPGTRLTWLAVHGGGALPCVVDVVVELGAVVVEVVGASVVVVVVAVEVVVVVGAALLLRPPRRRPSQQPSLFHFRVQILTEA